MFTGIIEQIGSVAQLTSKDDQTGYDVHIRHRYPSPLAIGESIAINGTCLTVVAASSDEFSAEISRTTAAITTLATLKPGQFVNLERAVTPSSRLGGHWVQGHVDEQGTIRTIEPDGEMRHVAIDTSALGRSLLVERGSVAVDGVSLTVVRLSAEGFHVTLIPHTLSVTTLGQWQSGQAVNLEFDVLAKYVKQLTEPYLQAR
jgi:riboflavin synthase